MTSHDNRPEIAGDGSMSDDESSPPPPPTSAADDGRSVTENDAVIEHIRALKSPPNMGFADRVMDAIGNTEFAGIEEELFASEPRINQVERANSLESAPPSSSGTGVPGWLMVLAAVILITVRVSLLGSLVAECAVESSPSISSHASSEPSDDA